MQDCRILFSRLPFHLWQFGHIRVHLSNVDLRIGATEDRPVFGGDDAGILAEGEDHWLVWSLDGWDVLVAAKASSVVIRRQWLAKSVVSAPQEEQAGGGASQGLTTRIGRSCCLVEYPCSVGTEGTPAVRGREAYAERESGLVRASQRVNIYYIDFFLI